MDSLRVVGVVFAMSLCSNLSAQELPTPRLLPGSVSVSAGTLSPSEPDNVTSTTSVDQGVTAWRSGSLFVLGYLAITQRNDTAGDPWNTNTPVTLGGRVVKTGTFGVLQANAGVGLVAHATTGTPVAPIAYVSYWAGWRNGPAKPIRFALAFPGHVWASSGVVTPLERNNWITSASDEQGVTVLRGGGFDLVPFGALTVVRDSQHYAWNNKSVIDVGVKIQRFLPGGVIEAGVTRRDESEPMAGAARSAPAVFVNVWLGWDARRVPHERSVTAQIP